MNNKWLNRNTFLYRTASVFLSMFFINRRLVLLVVLLLIPFRPSIPLSSKMKWFIWLDNPEAAIAFCDGFNDGDGDCQVGRLSPACHRIRIRHRRRVFMALLVLVMKWWQREWGRSGIWICKSEMGSWVGLVEAISLLAHSCGICGSITFSGWAAKMNSNTADN